METRIEIPDSLYPQLAAASSAEGLSIEAYVIEAAKEKLGDAADAAKATTDRTGTPREDHPFAELWSQLDQMSDEERQRHHEAVQEIQAIIDEEFSQIEPEMWERSSTRTLSRQSSIATPRSELS